MAKLRAVLLLALALNCAKGHVAYIGIPNRLHQVAHGVYMNPSADGTSADLYVAATEDNASLKKWLPEYSANYLQPGYQMPVSYTSALTTTSLPGEQIVTNQKRAAITSPPIKYAYALPVSSDGASGAQQTVQFPYMVPSTAGQTEGTDCADPAAAAAYPYALHWYYSQMMAAFANALHNAVKDTSDESTTTATPTAPVWPSYYPVQYVMVDPSTWAKSQDTSSSTTTPAPNTSASNETS